MNVALALIPDVWPLAWTRCAPLGPAAETRPRELARAPRPDEVARVDRVVPDHRAGIGGVDHHAAPGIDADVVEVAAEEHQATGLEGQLLGDQRQ